MSIKVTTEHPLPWSAHGVFIQDGRARIIGAMHTLAQTQIVVESVNCTAVAPAPGPEAPSLGAVMAVVADLPPPTPASLRERLAPADALALARELAAEHVHIVAREPAGLVLDAMKDVPSRTLEREQQRDDWRGRVAGAELTRRLDEITRIRNQG